MKCSFLYIRLINMIGVTWPFDEWNLNFLRDYAGIEMSKRVFDGSEDNTWFIPDPSLIKSGDTFQILRLDGLDPMIAWAMGSATGNCNLSSLNFDYFYVKDLEYLFLKCC